MYNVQCISYVGILRRDRKYIREVSMFDLQIIINCKGKIILFSQFMNS